MIITGRPTAQDIFDAARAQGVSAAKIAIINGVKADRNMWPDVSKDFNEVIESKSTIDLIGSHFSKGSLIADYAGAIAREVQFPVNTVFMHTLGCISSAISHRFNIEYNGELHPGLYIICSQPPSTGKSGVNAKLQRPISNAFAELNKANRKERARIEMRIEKLMDQKKQAGTAISEGELSGILMSLESEHEKLAMFPIFNYDITDVTPEALGASASLAGGNFTIISEEASAINTALGLSYGSEGKRANNETVLKGWDGGLVATVRIGRESKPFYARGAISVLAQNEAVTAILQAGQNGNGLTERFLVIQEDNMLGKRKFIDENGNLLYTPVDNGLIARYSNMVYAMVNGPAVKLKLSPAAAKMIAMQRQIFEPKLDNNAQYGSNLLRGVMGKMDKQICKIAAVLHAVEEWQQGGSQSSVIGEKPVAWAIEIFDMLSKTFIDAAQAEGYAGSDAEASKVLEKIIHFASSGKVVSFSKLYNSLRNIIPFKGAEGVSVKLREQILPELEEAGYIVFHNKNIHVNPKVL